MPLRWMRRALDVVRRRLRWGFALETASGEAWGRPNSSVVRLRGTVRLHQSTHGDGEKERPESETET